MSTDEIYFSSILCSKLCHDLVSPVGAIANGLEILADESDPEMIAQVAELLKKSTAQTANRLQFFRAAFGASNSISAAHDGAVEKTLAAVLSDKNISLSWEVDNSELSANAMKLLLILGFVAGDGLIRGGAIIVRPSAQSGRQHEVHASGERLIYDKTIDEVLSGATSLDNLEPRFAAPYVANKLAFASQQKVVLVRSGEQEALFQTTNT